ncbi:MAG: phosphoribosylformylglycinamidine synthase subunit PurS [Hyphomicrobiales bacterium]|jgi:phosphoribosylformylglycinamidine synthase subunit PurS|nr:phosphoribosylformylglycinamidine synthase subunit PurS [Hyphomicrobiales bacterium]|tara:strand:+ start:1294 stop:1533 length:240 start_codon:yes stop_codon:yes gene_type:complete
MKALVYVRLKSEVLDPQGQAIESALKNLGQKKISNVRQGKLIEMDINSHNIDEVKKTVDQVTKTLLANTVIEEYSIEIK